MILYFLVFIISCAALVYSGTWIVQYIVRIARFLEWKEFVVASLIMTFVTSLPEFFVALSAAFHAQPLLSLGNIMGSNIIALTLVIGIGGLMAGGLKLEEKTLQRSTIYAALIAPVPLFLMLDGYLSRWDGLVLCFIFLFYFHQLVLHEKRFKTALSKHGAVSKKVRRDFLKNLLILSSSIILLLVSSEGVVWSSVNLAQILGIPLSVIGLFLVAAGTSGPEIAFGMRSISMGHEEMTLGNTMGSIVVNSTLVVGMVSLIRPFVINDLSPYFIGVAFTMAIAALFLVFVRTGREISKKESIFLIFTYAFFFFVQTIF